jgi:Fic family protein
MMTFRGRRLVELKLPTGTVWLISDIAEAKGRQHLYTKQAPQLLKALREMALIQSVESSNRIEGVTVAPDRLIPLVVGNVKPRDRSEEEIRGYRRALSLIHVDAQRLEVTPDFLRQLHQTLQEGAADAGQWKKKENDIVEFRENAPPTRC